MTTFIWDEAKDVRQSDGSTASTLPSRRACFGIRCTSTTLDRVVDDEERFHAVGLVDGKMLLLVVHSYRDDHRDEVIRIISARRPTRRERWVYEQQNG